MAWVLTCATRLLDTSTTVTGTASPSSVNRRIMPTLRPNNPRELLRLIVFSDPDFNWPGLMNKTETQTSQPKSREAHECNPWALTWQVCGVPSTPHTAQTASLQFDFDVHASRQVQLHQGVHGFVGGVHDVHQALVGADFELVAAGLVDVWRTQNVETLHAGRQGHRALDDRAGALGGVHDFSGRGVDQLVIESLQADADFLLAHVRTLPQSMILATTPAPTARPPSRMAKRRPSSMAMGAISLTVIDTLSPGMTISLSAGNSMEPVTSVVRK